MMMNDDATETHSQVSQYIAVDGLHLPHQYKNNIYIQQHHASLHHAKPIQEPNAHSIHTILIQVNMNDQIVIKMDFKKEKEFSTNHDELEYTT